MDKSCLASMNLINIGNSFPNLSTTLLPNSSSLLDSIKSCSDLPSKLPFAITEISPLTVDNSQLSPVLSLSIGLPSTSLSFVPPQSFSFRIGLNLSGYKVII